MARNSFPIKSESGLVKCYAEKLTYSGDRMADECVTLKVRSSEPIDFEVGDYIEYRGEKFSLVKRPSCKKTARRGTDIESFSYESVKMWPESYKLRRIEMRDVVGSDNGLVTLMPDFSFYAKDVTALAERMMANISREYEDDEWVIKVLFKNVDDNADEDALYCYYVIEADGSTHYEGKISGYSYEAVGEKDQTVSISSQSVWSAMSSTIPDIFKINFIVRGREIVIGKEGISFEKYFKNNSLMYGMNKGAVSIESVPEENSEDLITRLYAYGNSTNMPARYYQRSDVEYYATFKTSVKFKSGTKTLYAARINKRIDFAAFQSGKEIPARYQNFGASYSYNVKATYNGVESKFVAILMGTYTYLIPDEDGKENMFANKCVGDAFYESSFKIVSNVEKSTVLQDEGFKTKITVARNSKNGHVSELSTLSSGSIFKFLHDGESSYFSEGDVLEYPNIAVVNDDLVDGDKIRVVVDKVTSEYLRFKLIYSTKTIVPASAFVSIPTSLKINGVDYDTTYNGSSYVVKDLLSETAISDGYSIALSKDQFVKGYNGTDVYPQYIEDSIGYVVYGNSIRTEEISEIPELDSNQDVEINYFRGIVKRYWPVAWTRISNDAALPNNVNVQKLMLPGFPDMSLKEFKDYDYKAKPVSFEEVGERGVDVKMVRLTLHLDKKIQNKYQHSITGPVVFKRKFLTGESGERIDVDMNNVYDGNLYLGDTLSFVDEMPASQADLFVQGATIEIVSGVAKTSDGLNVTAKISYVSAEATSSVVTMFFASDIEYSDDYFEQVIRVSGQDYSYKLEYNELYETWSIKDVDPSEADTISNNITSVPLDIVSGVYAYLLPEEYVTKTPRTPEIVCSEFDTNPYIESFDKDKIGLFEKSVTFDGSVEGYEDIHPSIEDTTFEDIRDAGYIIPDPQDNGDYESDDDANTVAEGSSLIDSGLYTDMSGDGVSVDVNPSTFSFKIKKLGFDLEEAMKKNSESKEISFKSGMCGGRTFSIIEGGVIEEDLYYKIICKREYDETLDRYFPYNAYNIQRGDKFVLLGISLPDMYIRIAAEKLYDSAIKYLNEHNYVSTSYSFEVDSIYMQRQHDSHVENNELSLHDTLKAGDYIRFTDEDIISDIESGTSTIDIVIDKIEITEGEDELPKYSITLRENKKLTKWQQIEKNFYNTATSLVEEKTAEAANSAVSRSAAAARKASVSTDGAQSVSGHKTFEEGVRVNGGLSADDIEAERLSVNGNSSFGGNVESDGYVPGELGYGWKINNNGQAEFDSMSIRKFLDVPELRYNKTTVLTGIQWHTVGAGAIEEVHIDSEDGGNTGYIKLKLEDGEYGAISVGDMCMGIFHNEDGGNELSSTDGRNGNFKIKGFQTVYFKITALCDENGETENPDGRNQYFRYALRPISDNWTMTYHPRATMSFACYANSSDSTRQCCMYSTTEYTIMLVGMVDWEYSGNNISLIEGNLNGFSIPAEKLVDGKWIPYTQTLTGYGIAFGNAYMWGNITQFNRNRYLVTQQVYYYSSNEDLKTVVGKWNDGKLTIKDFSSTPIEPTATSKNVFSVLKYTYSDNSIDYSTPCLSSMYGTEGKVGKDGVDGPQPNLFGYDTILSSVNVNGIVHTQDGIALYAQSGSDGDNSGPKGTGTGQYSEGVKGYRIEIDGMKLTSGKKHSVSFKLSQSIGGGKITCSIGGTDSGKSISYTTSSSQRFVFSSICGSSSSKVSITFGIDGKTSFEGLVDIQDLKVECTDGLSSESTAYNGLAPDNILQQPNLLTDSSTFGKTWTKYSKSGVVSEVLEREFNGQDVYHCCGKMSDSWQQILRQDVPLLMFNEEEWFTLSWYQKGTGTLKVYFVFQDYLNPAIIDCKPIYDTHGWGPSVTHTSTSKWERHTVTFRYFKMGTTSDIKALYFIPLSGNIDVYISMPKVERCERSTAWQVAESDRVGEDGVGVAATLSMDNIFVATVDGKLRDSYISEYVSVDVYEGSTKCSIKSVSFSVVDDPDGFIYASYGSGKICVSIKNKGEDWGNDKSIVSTIVATASTGDVTFYKTIKVVSIGQGKDGTEHTIDIDDDGYWVLDGETTAFKAEGDDGHSPKIVNGYWYEWNPETGDYQNTNIEAEGKSGLNAVSMYLSANTIVFPTKNGNIDTYAIDRAIQVKIYEGSDPKDTTITGATITGATGVSASYSGDVVTVSPQSGSSWSSDGSLNISASAVINGETVTLSASVNIVGSAQGQTVAGPQGESVTKIEEKYYATATKVAPSKDVDWSSSHIDPTYGLPYVWNIEIVTFYNPAATGDKYRTDSTEPHLCCEFADGMTSHTSTYAVTSTNSQPSTFPYSTVQAALDQMDETTNRFLWNREVTSYKDPNKNTDVVRLVTIWGEKGSDGKSVDSVTEKYCYGTDTTPSGNWTNNALLPTSEDGKRYVWNKEIVTYTNSDGTTSTSELTPHIIARYTSDGKGVQSYTTMYAVVSTAGVPGDSEFSYASISNAVNALNETNKYLWELEITYYTDNTNDGGVKRLISVHGKTGDPGTNGTSITSVTEQYAYGTETTPSNWVSSALTPKDQDGKRYVWNREAVTYKYSDNSTETKYLTPHIIARYVSDGRGVSGYTTTYAVTSTSATPSEFPYNDIASAVAVMSAELRFLWEKEITTFTDGTNDGGEIRLIAVNGLDGSGEDGADAPRPNIFGYDCVVSGTNTGNSIMRTDNGIVAYAKKTDSNNYYSVSIKLPENIIAGKRIGVHGTIYSPAGGDLTVVAVNASGSEVVTSSVTKITGSTNIEFASSFTLPNACRYIVVMVYPKSSLGSVITNYAGILQIKNLKIEDTTEISSTKTSFDGLSSYSIPRGENMLTNITSYDGWTKNANTSIERGAFQGQSVVSCGVSSNTIAIQKSISLKAGTRYTLSWWDKASSESMSFTPTILISDYNQGYTVLYSSVNGVAIAGPSSTPRVTYQAETEWTYRTIRFVAIGDVDASIQFYFNGTGTGYMSKPKLEEGDCDTEWIESPEDRKGLNGCVIRNRGEWNADTVYINESELNMDGVRYIDIVQYEQDDVIYYYQRNTYSSGYSAGVEPTNSRYWTSANVTDFIASKLIMTESEWVTMLSGKKIYVTDSTNEVVAGIQSVTEDDSPMIFAGASENNANSAKFRVYNNGRTVLENVEVKSADSVGNTLKLKDGSVQIIDKNGNILTTISQQSPSSVSDTMPSIPAQTDYASGSVETSGSTACVASGMTAQFVYYTEKEICSITPSNDGGVLKVPEIKYTVNLVSGNMTSAMNQIVMRYEAILYVDGEVEYSIPGEAKQSTSYINYTSSESAIPSFSKTVLKGVKTSVKLAIKTTYIAVLKSASTSTVQIPANSTKMTLSSVVSSAVEYGTYMNKILGNGFAFTNNSNSFFSYVNSVPTGDESMRFGQGNLRLSVKNGVQRISKNGGTNYANANPLVMVIRYTVSGGSISGREAIYNPFGLGVVAYSGSVDLTKNVADVKYSTNIFSFNHNMFGTSDRYIVQCMPVKTSACYAYIHSKASTYFRIGFSSEPTSFDVMIFDGLSY